MLAIFDDLDTILLMIPLQILMIGLRWQMFAIIAVVTPFVGRRLALAGDVERTSGLETIFGAGYVVCALTQLVHIVTARLLRPGKQHPHRSPAPRRSSSAC